MSAEALLHRHAGVIAQLLKDVPGCAVAVLDLSEPLCAHLAPALRGSARQIAIVPGLLVAALDPEALAEALRLDGVPVSGCRDVIQACAGDIRSGCAWAVALAGGRLAYLRRAPTWGVATGLA